MNIEEIKAREQAATLGPWKATFGMDCRAFVLTPDEDEDFKIYNHANADFIAHARTDIPELIAEVERLTAKLDILTGIEAQEHQQIATLKKALRLLSKHYVNSNFMNTSPKSVYDAFIQQAEQTHETQEAEK